MHKTERAAVSQPENCVSAAAGRVIMSDWDGAGISQLGTHSSRADCFFFSIYLHLRAKNGSGLLFLLSHYILSSIGTTQQVWNSLP